MDNAARIEECLERSLARASDSDCPPKLRAAVQSAVFPGGARVRPQLTLAVAEACGDHEIELVDGAAAAIELLHCASLVHDDLPCFDDAELRRGKPTIHSLYGEEIAVLTGDALIIEAFNTLCASSAQHPSRLPALVAAICAATGMTTGITAGQAWESADVVDVERYHCAKTGSLFVGAVCAGALAVGSDPLPWRSLGSRIGAAYQLADDLLDALGSEEESGKPVGQDRAHGRPSAVTELGFGGTVKRLNETVEAAIEAIPPCEGASVLESLIAAQSKRLVPASLAGQAA